jgi:hypothetical protein
MHSYGLRQRAATGAAALIILLAAALPASAQSYITVTVDGDVVNFAPPPLEQAGRIFVPLRGVFERLGASVVYDRGEINATGNGREISLQIGSTQATVDNEPETIDVAPFIVGASTYVPLRFVSEALGASVNWENSDQTVSITTVGVAPYEGPQDESYNYQPNYATYAPPPIPDYEQPYVPAPGDIWQPGYWAWGPYGYYWVPGTWVAPPQPGYLWTPGYWGYNNGGFRFNAGFWAIAVGFYGGINYGGGYGGRGYDGGRWDGNQFRYNTYVTRVNTTIIHNTYVNKTVYVNQTRTSYNGGPHGVAAAPTQSERSVSHQQHVGATPVQRQHVAIAAQDRTLLAGVNHGKPPVVAVAQPLAPARKPTGFVAVKPTDRVLLEKPVTRAAVAPARVAPVGEAHVAAPAHAAPVPAAARPAAAYHAPAPVRAAAPADRAPAPAYRAPAPAYKAPAYHAPAPVYHAPAAVARPAYHAPVAAPAAVHRAPAPQAQPARQPHPAPANRPAPQRPEDDHH